MCSNNSLIVIYHEKQIRELCALHALNNLFQDKNAFNKSDLDKICQELSPENWINPHKSLLGLGNYDVNVIIRILEIRGFGMVWFDKRKCPSCINLSAITGFILNIPSDYKLGFLTIPLKRRHWIAVKEINGIFFNLDSKLNSPKEIGRENELLSFLRAELFEHQDKELFIVMPSNLEKSGSWLKKNSNYTKKCVEINERDAEKVKISDI